MITVNARDAVTQTIVPIKLRAQRNNGCSDLAMNNALSCSGFANSKLKVWFDPSDNTSLRPGRYRAQFDVQARGWLDKAFNYTRAVDLDINLLPQRWGEHLVASAAGDATPYRRAPFEYRDESASSQRILQMSHAQ